MDPIDTGPRADMATGPRLRTSFVALVVICAFVLSAVTALADAEGATIDKTGWWNRANTTVASPAGPVTVPPPPGIPEGDLAVGATAGDPISVAAVGIQPDVGTGATVEAFTMTLREDPDAEANQGTESATIVACPIVEFWAGGEGLDWDTRPVADCEAAQVEGVRDDEGTWTFDLSPIGTLWFDPFSTVLPDGVLLRESTEPPSSFQVVFLGGDDIDVVLEASDAEAGDDPFAFDDPPTDAGLNSGPSGGGSSIFSPPVVTSPPTTFAPPQTTPPATTASPTGSGSADDTTSEIAVDPVRVTAEPTADRRGDIFGNLPGGALLLVFVFVGLLLVTSYWLGPAGQSATETRQRGVSRALDARARAASRSST